MSNNFSLNMNTRENNSNCMNNVLNKSNNKIFEHQFSILSNKNNNYVNTNGLTTQNDYNLNNIEKSTKLRNSKILKKTKKELNTRVFAGSPYMGRGSGVIDYTDINSMLNFGEDTRVKKSNNNVGAYSADNFIPLVPNIAENIQNPKHIIPEYWVRGGMSSRVVTNNIDYLKSCGFKK
jgi:hypothetical protein